jgi:hypothetical protein
MNSRSPSLDLVIGAAALLVLVAGVLALMPLLGRGFRLVLGALPVLFTVIGLISCITSGKRSSIILLWIVVMLLGPVLGPLLWFVWGRKNT